jgi:heptosyltransferase-1
MNRFDRMPDILFIKTSSLGDVIHHMPAVTDARRHRPDARFAWVVEEAFAPLAALHRNVDRVIPVASRRWRKVPWRPATWRELRRFTHALRDTRYDTVIDTQGLLRSGLIAKLARGERHGYDAASIRERAAAPFYDVQHRVARSLHAIARNRILTGLALGYAPEGPPDFGLGAVRAPAAAGRKTAVLLHATARAGKQWPDDRWRTLAELLNRQGFDVVLPSGSEAERARSTAIAAGLANVQLLDRQPLDAVARVMAGAAVVVGVDTGLLHLAAALRVPLVAIFVGASDPALTGPMGGGRIEILTQPAVTDVAGAIETVLKAQG